MGFPRQRCRQPEVLDQPDLGPDLHRQALAALARVNFLSRTAGSYFRPLLDLQLRLGADRLRILDLACGGGDVAVRLWRRADRRGLDWRIAGCDISPLAVEAARDRALRHEAPVHFFINDLLSRPLGTTWDAVICSLFLHRLDDDRAVELLRGLARLGARLVLINDLDRTRAGLVLAHVVSRLPTTSPVVHVAGPLSVRAAFRPHEAVALAEKAGLHNATVRRCWPWRWLLSWRRP